MLRLLLDIHIDPVVAQQIARHRPTCEVVSLRDWRQGSFRQAEDEEILTTAHEEGWTFVTYDQHSIIPLVQLWADLGIAHAGVIFVDIRTIAPNNIGGLVRAIIRVWDRDADLDWQNLVLYL